MGRASREGGPVVGESAAGGGDKVLGGRVYILLVPGSRGGGGLMPRMGLGRSTL